MTQNTAYYSNIAAKSAIGIGILNDRRARRDQSGFFVSNSWQAFMGGPCGELKSSPVPVAGMPTYTVPLTLIGIGVAEIKTAQQESLP